MVSEVGGLEDAECIAEVSLSPEEANLLMGRVAYDMNHVIQDVEDLQISPQPPLPDELEVLSEASDSRPGATSVEPSPGTGLTEDCDLDIEADVEKAEDIVAISSDSSSDDKGTMFATLATVRTGTNVSDWL